MTYQKHGMWGSRIYNIWRGMRRRCNNPNRPEYQRYGGKGIKVCDEWQYFVVFRDWALVNGYTDDLTIDRINPSGNYCPENCRWIAASQNSINAHAKKVKCVETGEVFESASAAARALNLSKCAISIVARSGGTCLGNHWEYITPEKENRV